MGLRIGIAGAGIGGLGAAALLACDGHDVTVFDRFEAPRPVGSGLVIQPVGQEVLGAAGALRTARAHGRRIARMAGDEADGGRTVLEVAYGTTPDRQGLAIHRAALFEALLDAAGAAGATLVPGEEVVAAKAGEVTGRGGVLGRFDLVVDALGAASALSPLRARPLPYGAVWANVPWPDDTALPADQLTQRYRRADRMLGVLPIGTRPGEDRPLAAIFYSLRVDRIHDWDGGDFGAWCDDARALWPEFAPFLAGVERKGDFVAARYGHGTLAHPWDTRLVHIGDAAHRASPQLGQGANMALLDARALQLALRRADGDEALHLYAAARRWHVRTYQAFSAVFTPQYQSDSRVLPVIRDRVLAPLSRAPGVRAILTRLVCGDLLAPMAALAGAEPHRLRPSAARSG